LFLSLNRCKNDHIALNNKRISTFTPNTKIGIPLNIISSENAATANLHVVLIGSFTNSSVIVKSFGLTSNPNNDSVTVIVAVVT